MSDCDPEAADWCSLALSPLCMQSRGARPDKVPLKNEFEIRVPNVVEDSMLRVAGVQYHVKYSIIKLVIVR